MVQIVFQMLFVKICCICPSSSKIALYADWAIVDSISSLLSFNSVDDAWIFHDLPVVIISFLNLLYCLTSMLLDAYLRFTAWSLVKKVIPNYSYTRELTIIFK